MTTKTTTPRWIRKLEAIGACADAVEWARITGNSETMIRNRLWGHWPTERAVLEPSQKFMREYKEKLALMRPML